MYNHIFCSFPRWTSRRCACGGLSRFLHTFSGSYDFSPADRVVPAICICTRFKPALCDAMKTLLKIIYIRHFS